ncbi:MAG: hypothetical protein HZA90_12420 [Verrucomicrobia bacterium]|nr:hypothetical protein [Verrucomicrobiota bacterium]
MKLGNTLRLGLVLPSLLSVHWLWGLSTLGAEPGTRARYLLLTAQPNTPPPAVAVDFITGPMEKLNGATWHWWQLELRSAAAQSNAPLCVVRGLTSADPLAGRAGKLEFARYLLRLPDLGETLDYRDRHSGRALLPGWKNFEQLFVPRPAESSQVQRGVPETCEFLGHVLTLIHVGSNEVWKPWTDAKTLVLDRELLVGTGRPFKDKEGRRLPQQPQRTDYTYVPFEPADYRVMIDAGLNLFVVKPDQEPWVRTEPVFYLRGAGGQPSLRYPADLYRANYLGPVMFMDEPSILMVGDKLIHNTLRYFSDAAALIETRTRHTYLGEGSYGAFALEKALRGQGANFGDMRLMQWDYPSWETLYDTTFYQMKGGGNGLVHEGRYQLADFDKAVERFTGQPRRHTAREMLQYHYAFLRGGTRPFGKFWGTAIYGQCDTNLAPEAVTLAYDLGARYVWFWTSDHDHHVPWPEQLALARTLQRHTAAHPRPSVFGPPPVLDTAIVIPNGYFLSLDNLWWVRVLDKEGKNEASQNYRRLMQRALRAVHECFDRQENFDITVDDGREITGYRRVVRVRDGE